MKHFEPVSIDEAWANLAADVLLQAIADVRQSHDLKKREYAKRWLISPAAGLFFDAVLNPSGARFDVREWVNNNCLMDKK